MLYVIFNQDGSIKYLSVGESIQQGDHLSKQLFAAIEGIRNTDYVCSASFVLPNGEINELASTEDTQEVYQDNQLLFNEPIDGYTIIFTEAQTYLAGNLKVNLKLIDLQGHVLCSYQVTLKINPTGYNPDETNITEAQYNSLLQSLQSIVPATVSSVYEHVESYSGSIAFQSIYDELQARNKNFAVINYQGNRYFCYIASTAGGAAYFVKIWNQDYLWSSNYVLPSTTLSAFFSGTARQEYAFMTNIPTVPTKTSDLTNDGDGNSPFATESYVGSAVSGATRFKGTVADLTTLNAIVDPNQGDMYWVTSESSYYIWNGSSWNATGGQVDLSNYMTLNTDQNVSGKKYIPYFRTDLGGFHISTASGDTSDRFSFGYGQGANLKKYLKIYSETHNGTSFATNFYWEFPNKSGTIALTSDIITDGRLKTVSIASTDDLSSFATNHSNNDYYLATISGLTPTSLYLIYVHNKYSTYYAFEIFDLSGGVVYKSGSTDVPGSTTFGDIIVGQTGTYAQDKTLNYIYVADRSTKTLADLPQNEPFIMKVSRRGALKILLCKVNIINSTAYFKFQDLSNNEWFSGSITSSSTLEQVIGDSVIEYNHVLSTEPLPCYTVTSNTMIKTLYDKYGNGTTFTAKYNDNYYLVKISYNGSYPFYIIDIMDMFNWKKQSTQAAYEGTVTLKAVIDGEYGLTDLKNMLLPVYHVSDSTTFTTLYHTCGGKPCIVHIQNSPNEGWYQCSISAVGNSQYSITLRYWNVVVQKYSSGNTLLAGSTTLRTFLGGTGLPVNYLVKDSTHLYKHTFGGFTVYQSSTLVIVNNSSTPITTISGIVESDAVYCYVTGGGVGSRKDKVAQLSYNNNLLGIALIGLSFNSQTSEYSASLYNLTEDLTGVTITDTVTDY